MQLAPLVMLWMLSRKKSAPAAAHRHPKWPTTRHPPPKHARKVVRPPAQHKPAHHAAHHAQHPAAHPAEHPEHHAPEHHVHHEVHHDQPHVVHHPAVHHAASHPMGAPAVAPIFPQEEAQHESLPELHAAPPEPTPPAHSVEQHQEPVGQVSVSNVQAILRGLGWRGDLTTSGPLSPALTDGLNGPVTHRDWMQSANKRQLDPTIERVDGQTVRVNPDTYAALRDLARSRGAQVSGRRLYIP